MGGEVNGSGLAKAEPAPKRSPVRRDPPRIAPHRYLELCRDLARGERTQASLAAEHGVSGAAISKFRKRNERRIAEIAANLDDEFAGIWIADKTKRLQAYQGDYELIAASGFHEHVKSRTAILKAVAEELGQLPGRTTVSVTPVIHIIEGVSVDELT